MVITLHKHKIKSGPYNHYNGPSRKKLTWVRLLWDSKKCFKSTDHVQKYLSMDTIWRA